jgi:integrase
MARTEATKTPGIHRAHRDKCKLADADGCECPYVVRFRNGNGDSRKRTFPKFELAREFQRKIENGEESRQQTTATVKSYYGSWIETYRGRTARGLDPGTRNDYRGVFDRYIVPKLGRRKLRELSSLDIDDWFTALEGDGVSPAMIGKAKRTLSAMLATAKQKGVIAHNPVAGVRYIPSDAAKVRHPVRKRKALTGEDVIAILATMDDQWRLFFTVLATTGMRISEALGLTWKNVHLGDDPEVTVAEQFYKGRRKPLKTEASASRVPISASVAAWLADHKPEDAGPDDPVFTTKTGGPLNYGNVYHRVLRPALIDAGIADVLERDEKGKPTNVEYHGVAFHSFRKACGSLLLARGRTPKQVQAWLRHARLSTTMDIYTHLVDDNLGSADDWDDILAIGGRDARDTAGTPNTREQPQTVDG